MYKPRKLSYVLPVLTVVVSGMVLGSVILRGGDYIASVVMAETKVAGEMVESDPVTYEREIRETRMVSREVPGQALPLVEFLPPERGKAISVNLDEAKVRLYEDGELVAEHEVLSIGKKGSPWETPPGLYSIKTKEVTHFSSIGEVNMPYSMQFFGNYFIHGWPYYPDGTPVPEGYSGGCIRLSQEDASRVFSFSEYGTPVSVERNATTRASGDSQELSYYTYPEVTRQAPLLRAKAYVIADLETGEILYERNKDTVVPIASVTKLLTALVDLEVVNQFQTATVSDRAYETHGDSGLLKKGGKISTGDLIYPTLLTSSNDATEVIAEHVGRSFFMRKMNEKSKAIGLFDTHFDDPSGISDENTSTAADLFRLAHYIYRNKQHVYDVTLLKKYTTKDKKYTWYNNNKFVIAGEEHYRGGKSGLTTAAGHTLLATFSLPMGEFGDKRDIAMILLNSPDRYHEMRRMKSWLTDNVYYGVKTEKLVEL